MRQPKEFFSFLAGCEEKREEDKINEVKVSSLQ